MSRAPIDTTRAVERLRVLSNPARLRIAMHLLERECPVAEIETALDLRQPALSQQLAELRDGGILAARREGKSVIYRLADEKQRRLVQGLVFGLGGSLPVTEEPARPARPASPVLGAVFATVEPTE